MNYNLAEYKIKKLFEGDIIHYQDMPIKEKPLLWKRLGDVDTTLIKNEENRQLYKDFILSCLIKGKPYNINSKIFYTLFSIFGYLMDFENFFLSYDKDKLKKDFIEYSNTLSNKDFKKCFDTFWLFANDNSDQREGFDRDYWDAEVFQISDERKNKANSLETLNFYDISFEPNRTYVKAYIKNLLTTELSFSTVYNTQRKLVKFVNSFEEKDLKDLSLKDLEDFLKTQDSYSDDWKNKYVDLINRLYEYCFAKGLVKEKLQLPLRHKVKIPKRQPKLRSLTDSEINQIFRHLHEAPFNLMLMFLINYTTGIRRSDLCQIKKDCLYSDGEGGYYVSYWCQKMKQSQRNLIPVSLYELIEEQIKLLNSKEEKSQWLFPSENDITKPYKAQTYSNKFKRLCNEWGILKEDGTTFNFESHGLRHTVATNLYSKYKVDATIIQLKVLQHQELDMTVQAYIERPSELRKLQEDKYIDKAGESHLTKWMVDTLQGRILTNGICGQPEVLEPCPNGNACLTCEFFKTSKEFLPALKGQLQAIKERLPIYEANNWVHNIATAKEDIKNLENLITRLTKGG